MGRVEFSCLLLALMELMLAALSGTILPIFTFQFFEFAQFEASTIQQGTRLCEGRR